MFRLTHMLWQAADGCVTPFKHSDLSTCRTSLGLWMMTCQFHQELWLLVKPPWDPRQQTEAPLIHLGQSRALLSTGTGRQHLEKRSEKSAVNNPANLSFQITKPLETCGELNPKYRTNKCREATRSDTAPRRRQQQQGGGRAKFRHSRGAHVQRW